jgi:hypothetical protein
VGAAPRAPGRVIVMAITVISDLRSEFGPARDQGSRPTCMAFAGSDTHAGKRPGWEPLSIEWAYFRGLQREKGSYGDGISLSGMLAALEHDGQPMEVGWPYDPNAVEKPAAWEPPDGVSPLYRRRGAKITPTPAEVLKHVDAGSPVLLAMRLSMAFYGGWDAEGVISSLEAPDPNRRHAVIALAHGQRAGAELVLVRNSWGLGWAAGGHAWLDTAYLAPRIFDAAVLTEEP